MNVYTIGFSGKSAEQFFALLRPKCVQLERFALIMSYIRSD